MRTIPHYNRSYRKWKITRLRNTDFHGIISLRRVVADTTWPIAMVTGGLILRVRVILNNVEMWEATDSDGRYSSISSSLGIAKSKIEDWAIKHCYHNLNLDNAPAQELDRNHARKFVWNFTRSQTVGSIVLGGLDVFVQEEIKLYLDSLDDNSSRMSTANKMKHASNLFSCISRATLEFSKSLDKVYDSIKGDL